MVKDNSDSEKGNPLPPHRLLLSINSKGSFYNIIINRVTDHNIVIRDRQSIMMGYGTDLRTICSTMNRLRRSASSFSSISSSSSYIFFSASSSSYYYVCVFLYIII